ncbi:hypothetical protein [Winogradskyella sp. PG-2]|uniref:hypothetical protein n=1 Tax=Winogradskyella sp. PG-2 TaxID=754409 RepID=UPI0004588CF2|nr:hypothetical protein [Winogradskyella sp. PG-2]BAO76622.1 hypothetical protein WPG_2392 [Winogradskyella sp. PG-2]
MIVLPNINYKKLQVFFYLSILLILCSCPSDDECIKTITIPQTYFVGNQSYTNEIEQEVPCDFPEPSEPEIIEAPILENFTYQILSFNYQSDTGNNTTRLQFEIQLNNHSNFDVNGVPRLTVMTEGLQFSAVYSDNASIPCYEILANSSCILTYDQESSLDVGIASDVFEIINVEYILTN